MTYLIYILLLLIGFLGVLWIAGHPEKFDYGYGNERECGCCCRCRHCRKSD